ncbi:MAG: GreA/GreB family elongation factor [Betaproteobacteria bacterium]|nr:GreA/GreB family elongation factor [Betaproteobacteria bacterium]
MNSDKTAGDGNIIVTSVDKQRLLALIEQSYQRNQHTGAEAGMVMRRLRAAQELPPEKVPRDVVTMNSTFSLRSLDGKEQRELTLVYPEDHDPDEGCWSVFGPVGAALYALRVGDELELALPKTEGRRWRLDNVIFQPEARGWMSL